MKIGKQWIEEDRHMYKAISKYVIKALGPVNGDGCLAEERTGVRFSLSPNPLVREDISSRSRIWN